MTTLTSFLNERRVEPGGEWNLTGMAAFDKGRYLVADEEYEEFLSVFHNHVFGRSPRASSLLEKHKEAGPPLIDFDARYEMGGPLVRRFTPDHVRDFIAHYIAAMVYFSKVEGLDTDLEFYHLEKPSPETDRSHHKDGVHIQCPSLATLPRYQYCIRGFLLGKGVIGKVFGSTGFSNAPEDFYDVSVIHKNNWFLYGACKPDKAYYTSAAVYSATMVPGSEITAEKLVAEDPECWGSSELIKLLSLQRGHDEITPLTLHTEDAAVEVEGMFDLAP